MSLSQDNTADFIESYRDMPVLWDIRLKDYDTHRLRNKGDTVYMLNKIMSTWIPK